jgi:protocatechuate 3,4-dioxygenase beta subunit
MPMATQSVSFEAATSTALAALPPTATPIPAPAATATALPIAPTATAVPLAIPACVVRPEQTEGPYFVDDMLNRADIRSNPSDGVVKEGVPLLMSFAVTQIGSAGCVPLSGAMVDIWHCDALGVYSDVNDPRFSTVGQQFLRGYQVTDAKGIASFTTIYPGWYQGRTVHIHFKIRATIDGREYDFTSQLYFDDAITDLVFTQPPYSSKGRRVQRNEDDGIYRNNGDQLLIVLTPSGDGYAGTFDIGLTV